MGSATSSFLPSFASDGAIKDFLVPIRLAGALVHHADHVKSRTVRCSLSQSLTAFGNESSRSPLSDLGEDQSPVA